MKLILKIVLTVFIIFLLVSGGGIFYLSRGLEAGNSLEINTVNLADIKDGTYKGEYKAGRWTNETAVTVKDHKIVSVDVVKDVVFSKPEVKQQLIEMVIKNQSTDIDVISGSTVTCKAYLKSIETALK